MNLIALTTCFFFVFCHGYPRHAQSYPQHNIIEHGPQFDATGKSCAQITKGFDSWGNQDDWVSEFPVAQQHRVLECLDKKWKQENPGDTK